MFVPRFRPDIAALARYKAGRPISGVARSYGFEPADVVKLASNENPLPPFPEVEKAMAEALTEVNRYPDDDAYQLREALSRHLDVAPNQIWVGGGSSELLRVAALAVGGPGTTAVYAWPSFVIYRLATIWAMSQAREVPLDAAFAHDLERMAETVGSDTTVVYVCNPNNPTGTVVPADDLRRFLDLVPERCLVVVDEAYHEYVTDPTYSTMLPEAVSRPNLVVTRTFSKVYGLAALRVGYAVASADLVAELRKAQAPFTVTSIGQVAAVEALRHPGRVAERVEANRVGREWLEERFAELGVSFVPSQANFVFFRVGASTDRTTEAFLRHGVIVRPMADGWVRVTVGTPEENRRFAEALEAELPVLSRPGDLA
jgi:histidinol-phosphate aminotransferase